MDYIHALFFLWHDLNPCMFPYVSWSLLWSYSRTCWSIHAMISFLSLLHLLVQPWPYSHTCRPYMLWSFLSLSCLFFRIIWSISSFVIHTCLDTVSSISCLFCIILDFIYMWICPVLIPLVHAYVPVWVCVLLIPLVHAYVPMWVCPLLIPLFHVCIYASMYMSSINPLTCLYMHLFMYLFTVISLLTWHLSICGHIPLMLLHEFAFMLPVHIYNMNPVAICPLPDIFSIFCPYIGSAISTDNIYRRTYELSEGTFAHN